jgi:hypothetical protein
MLIFSHGFVSSSLICLPYHTFLKFALKNPKKPLKMGYVLKRHNSRSPHFEKLWRSNIFCCVVDRHTCKFIRTPHILERHKKKRWENKIGKSPHFEISRNIKKWTWTEFFQNKFIYLEKENCWMKKSMDTR